MNCKAVLQTAPKTFQGVVICDDCYRIVSRMVEKTKSEMQMVFLAYTDMLRVALVRGELRPPSAPPSGQMPAADLASAVKRLVENHGGRNGQQEVGTPSDSQVPGVRGNQDDPDGEVRGG
jgi:hypothetical protein